MTITEALAEIKTIEKRIAKKRESVQGYLARQDMLRDPLAQDGGSVEFIKRERQAIRDLEERVVLLRRAIAYANSTTTFAVGAGPQRSIADWLTYRREVAPGRQAFLTALRDKVERVRREALSKGVNVVAAASAVTTTESKPTDVLVNISEVELAKDIEALEEELGSLDGRLSLLNATTQITV